MHQFEIRILNEDRTPSLVMYSMHLNDFIAVRAGRRLAEGKPFEIWRGDECVYGIADDKPLPFPVRRAAQR